MTKDQFIKELSEIFDKAAHWSSGSRTFVDTERTDFFDKAYDFMMGSVGGKTDYTSPQFFYALKRAEKNFISVQDQCAHLESYLQEEIAKAKDAQKKKTP